MQATGRQDVVIGLDEAGRGPILGPMVMACVALDSAAAARLAERGVTDSKRFGAGWKAHAARAELCAEILAVAAHTEVLTIEVAEIDTRTARGELNRLEQEHAARLIDRAPPAARVFADGARIFAPLRARYPHLHAEDRADSLHVAVSAASLLAKVRRDELWLAICGRYQPEFGEVLTGYCGGGYLNAATRRFLRAYCARYRQIPPEGRRSWPWDFVRDLLEPAEWAAAARYRDSELQLPGFE